MAELIPSKDKQSSLIPESTPNRYRSSPTSHHVHHVTSVPSTSTAISRALENIPFACKIPVQQFEIEFSRALEALSMIQDSDNDFKENTLQFNPFLQNVPFQDEELQSRYRLARHRYKAELWNRDFEPVLQRIRAAAASIAIADLEKNVKSETVRQLMASGCVIQKEQDALDGLLSDCVRLAAILGSVGLFLGTLSGTGQRCGSWSDHVSGSRKNTDTTPTELLQTTAISDSKDEEEIGFRLYCDSIFTSLQKHNINANANSPPFADNISSTPTVSAPLITYLYTSVIERIATAQLRAENASLIASMVRERKQFNATFTEVQCRNEEDLSLAAGLVIEAVNVQAQVEQVRAATRADLGVSGKIREEIDRRRSVN